MGKWGVIVLGLSGLLVACSSQNDPCQFHREAGQCEPLRRSPVDPSGNVTTWVVDSITFPTGAAESTDYGANIDGDDLCRVDNGLGQALAGLFGLFGPEDDVNVSTDELIKSARIVHLLQVRAASLVDAEGVGVQFYRGEDADDDPANNLDGSGVFVADVGEAGIELSGAIAGSVVRANMGTVPLTLAFSESQAPVQVDAQTAFIDARIETGRVFGQLQGVITDEQWQTILLPLATQVLAGKVADSCHGAAPNCCDPGTTGATLVGLFDLDHDCMVSTDELRNSNLIKALLSPDVDMFDAQGRYNPLCDGEKDSMSFGLRFTAVPATF